MSNLWLYALISREPLFGFRAKILTLGALAATFPFALLAAHGLRGADASAGQTALLAALLGSAAALALVWRHLSPVAAAAASLRRAAAAHAPADAAQSAGVDQLVEDAIEVAARLESVRDRLNNRHPVSGLPTREPFMAALDEERMPLAEAAVLGVIRLGDYDRLAAFDHGAAEAALKAFAQRLQDALGPDRLMAQVDRDCFAVWLEDAAGAQNAAAELQALAFVLGQEVATGDIRFMPEVALGGAIFPSDGDTASTLLTRGFAAMPKTGAAGGKAVFFSAESSAAAKARFSLEQELRQAISREEFLLHYQPVVDLADGSVVGAEALLRWSPPGRGLVSPAEFIPVLEQSGMIDEVGLWVLNTACRQARAWQEDGVGDLKMAVNLSARQFRDPALNTVIVRTLERHGLTTNLLELELTETATMEDAKHTRQMFGDLRDLGVSVALDDFGTGYSSLSYLKNLPFSKLKIDREFVTQVNERRDSHAICTALVELARGLDISVLAEGVETREELETLRLLGCSMFQGYFFARPLAAEEFASKIHDPEWLALLASPVHRRIAALGKRIAR